MLRSSPDPVNHPPHYAQHPSGVECVELAEHLSFNLGNALKYLWRAGKKDVHVKGKKAEDVKKALWYVEREHRLWLTVPDWSLFPSTRHLIGFRLFARKVIDSEETKEEEPLLYKFVLLLFLPESIEGGHLSGIRALVKNAMGGA